MSEYCPMSWCRNPHPLEHIGDYEFCSWCGYTDMDTDDLREAIIQYLKSNPNT